MICKRSIATHEKTKFKYLFTIHNTTELQKPDSKTLIFKDTLNILHMKHKNNTQHVEQML